jgi:hypothetical protein
MATIRGNERRTAPRVRLFTPGPIVSFNAYELARRASYWRPTRWILSILYARQWNRSRGYAQEKHLQLMLQDMMKSVIYGTTAITEALAEPNPLLDDVAWR